MKEFLSKLIMIAHILLARLVSLIYSAHTHKQITIILDPSDRIIFIGVVGAPALKTCINEDGSSDIISIRELHKVFYSNSNLIAGDYISATDLTVISNSKLAA